MTNYIEIVVEDGYTNTEKGRLFEGLVESILERMQYKIYKEVRVTGSEIDLIGIHRKTEEHIYIECKAHKSNIESSVISQILGNIEINEVSSGWLITTSPLTKDAKGLKYKWEQKDSDKRRKLIIYEPQELIDVLVSSGEIVSSKNLYVASEYKYSDDNFLIVSNLGIYWCKQLIDSDSGMINAVIAYDAKTGEPITQNNKLDNLNNLDTSLKELKWIKYPQNDVQIDNLPSIKNELESVVTVPSADSWTDYRPSRPQDFVGRDRLQKDIFEFLDSVVLDKTSTRLLAIKSPSGWGKSSCVNKLVHKSRNKRNKNKYYIYGVDCRAAISSRFAEMAMVQCLKAAIQDNFIPDLSAEINISSVSQPFSENNIKKIVDYLKHNKKIIVLFFDQFEEIFSKNELANLFQKLNSLCHGVDAVQENFILGFSWKTDGTIPQDHPAYHMWQNMSDRRLEFTLPAFSPKEVSKSLSMFEKQLNEKLNPQVRHLISEQCQGFPWLLKKLCIHVYESLQKGTDQLVIANEALNVKELFESELATLTSHEIACVKRIAAESPIAFHEVEESFGGEVIHSLLDKRIILRTGSRLMLYWDIFKDFVLTGRVPSIPISYIPQSDPTRYIYAVKLLIKHGSLKFTDLRFKFNLSHGSTNNLVRDLVMVGNASADRKSEKLKALQYSESDAVSSIQQFCRHHILIKSIIEEKGLNFNINSIQVRDILKNVYKKYNYSELTWNIYANRLISWFKIFGIISIDESRDYQFIDSTMSTLPDSFNPKLQTFASSFQADTSPQVVLNTMQYLYSYNFISKENKSSFRNSFQVLRSLGLIYSYKGNIYLSDEVYNYYNFKDILRDKARNNSNYIAAKKIFFNDSSISGKNLGYTLANIINKNWSESSAQRYGSAFIRWIKWVDYF